MTLIDAALAVDPAKVAATVPINSRFGIGRGRMVKVIPSNASAAGLMCQQRMSGSQVSHLLSLVNLIRM